MKRSINQILTLFLILLSIGCGDSGEKPAPDLSDGWKTESQILKQIKNVHFNFPAQGYAFEHKDDLIDECFAAMEANRQLIGLENLQDTIQIRFLNSRDDMFWLTRSSASGIAYPHINTLYVVADGEKSSPIKHELMHLIAMLKWGYPHSGSNWVNEGLAAYAEGSCNGYDPSQLYRFFQENEMLIPVETLIADFYAQAEMIAYHQSAYLVEYLLKEYSIAQFQQLWTSGPDNFQDIYGIPFSEMKTQLEASLMQKHPQAPSIDWDSFKEGCK